MTALNVFAAVMNTGEFVIGSVCADCMFYIANGEHYGRPNQAVAAKLFSTLNKYEVTFGHSHKDNEWDDERCYHFGSNCSADCDCEATDFSNSPCFGCETRTAGARFDVIGINRGLLHTNMTDEQYNKLSDLCQRYGVKMNIGDYLVNSPNSSMMPGWAEGWVGGPNQAQKTIYIGVSPEGDSHS